LGPQTLEKLNEKLDIIYNNGKEDLKALLAAVTEAFYLSYGRAIRRKVPILSLMLFIYLVSTFTVLVTMVLTKSALMPSPISAEVVLLPMGLGVLPTALAHTLSFKFSLFFSLGD